MRMVRLSLSCLAALVGTGDSSA
jgi:hypothetical protein